MAEIVSENIRINVFSNFCEIEEHFLDHNDNPTFTTVDVNENEILSLICTLEKIKGYWDKNKSK